MGNNTVTRLPGGITNVAQNSIFADMVKAVPTLFTEFYEDFFNYTAGNWVVTQTGVTTQALTAGNGGLLLGTNSAGNGDLMALQKTPAMLLMSTTQKCFFGARLKVSQATLSSLLVGMQVVTALPFAATDGIYFLKNAAATSVDIVSRKDATTGSTSVTSITNMADDTFILLEWAYDGAGKLAYAVNGVVLGSIDITNFFPDTNLTVSFALTNGSAVSRTMTVDYMYVAQERSTSGA